MDLKSTYNRIAQDWHKDHQDDNWWVETTDKFVQFLKPDGLVLDVGCGAGVKSKYLINKGLKVIGIDFSKEMINIAKREVPDGKFLVMDMRDVRELKEKFDAIFMQAVLLHVPKKEVRKTLEVLQDILIPHGYFYIAVKEKKPHQPEEEIRVENDYGYKYKRFFSYFNLDEIKNYISDLNLKVCYESVTSSGNSRWIQLICQKN